MRNFMALSANQIQLINYIETGQSTTDEYRTFFATDFSSFPSLLSGIPDGLISCIPVAII